MKIIVLMGSPNRNGSTGTLVESFKRGAEEAGHLVEVIDNFTTRAAGKAKALSAAFYFHRFKSTDYLNGDVDRMGRIRQRGYGVVIVLLIRHLYELLLQFPEAFIDDFR